MWLTFVLTAFIARVEFAVSQEESCKVACTLIYQPVCASCTGDAVGLRTFPNDCALERQNTCNPSDPCTKIINDVCPSPPTTECPSVCGRLFSPVCAQCSGGQRTFSNSCTLRKANCESTERCRFLRQGSCSQICPRTCPRTQNPICALCAHNSYRIFTNLCQLYRFNCLNRQNCGFVGRGASCIPGRSRLPLPIPQDLMSVASLVDAILNQQNGIPPPEGRESYQPGNKQLDEPGSYQHSHPQVREDSEDSPLESTEQAIPDDPSYVIIDYPTSSENGTERPDIGICAATMCSDIYRPVCARCGTSSETFTNACMLNLHNCFNNNECTQLYETECDVALSPSETPTLCSTEYSPVCASCSNGQRTFPNECLLSERNLLNPDENCTEVSNGLCRPKCGTFSCARTKQPVCALCGSRILEFENECFYTAFNCPNLFICKRISASRCIADGLCPKEWKPICGACPGGLKTFSNTCFLDSYNKANPSAKCIRSYKGQVGACPSDCAMMEFCTAEMSPVCVQCGNYFITFQNQCQFSQYKCHGNSECKLLRRGSC